MLDWFAVPLLSMTRPPLLPYFACESSRLISAGAVVGGWLSQAMLDLHLLPVDHEPEELCLHRRGLNRRRHLIDAERVGPVLIEFPGKAVDGHLMPFCLFVTEFGLAVRATLTLRCPRSEHLGGVGGGRIARLPVGPRCWHAFGNLPDEVFLSLG